MNKLVILLVIFSISLNVNLVSISTENMPYIKYSSDLMREFWDRRYDNKLSVTSGFNRQLKEKRQELLDFRQGFTINKEKTINNKYDGIYCRAVNSWSYGMMPRALYIFPKKANKSIGYLLLDEMTINNLPQGTDPVLNNIRALNTNQSYLSGLNFPSDAIVTNYEIKHDGFIERYIIAKVENLEVLIGEMFYPEELDSKLTPYTYDFLQKMTRKIKLYNKIKSKTATPTEKQEYRTYDESEFE